ncbi:MAG: protein kinase [Deltaproteobacteria bacterium]|nr:protein kinase [Deltaproteobacteria bacterium]
MSNTRDDKKADSTMVGSASPDSTMVGGQAPARAGSSSRYTIKKTLGKGAMGVVYLAHDRVLERDVAIKELHSNLAQNSDLMDRFRLEAKVLARMTHPGIVQVYDFVEDGDKVWIVMEFVKGEDLSEYFKRKSRLSMEETVALGTQLAQALSYAHSLGIIHRDFKPANVLLTESGVPKIMDFGLAKLIESAHHTMAGTILGTPSFMSPEQASGQPADEKSDIYAFGVVLYRMVTGKLPFEGELASILAQHINTPPKPPKELNPEVPDSIQGLILNLMEKSPAKRAKDMATVVGLLKGDATAARTILQTPGAEVSDIETFMAKRQSMEKMFEEKFTKHVTVMFTDLKGSTTIAEKEGDLSSRILIQKHNEIVFPIIKDNHGHLVKTMGDGTLSYFEKAQDAVRAGAAILKACDNYNVKDKPKAPIIMRVGMHTGNCIVEQNDIFGDVVNTASRFESNSAPMEIYMSEETYNSLEDKGEIYTRYIKTINLKGKSEPFKVYKAFWNPEEIEKDMAPKTDAEVLAKKRFPPAIKVALIILIPLLILIFITQYGKIFKGSSSEERRSIDRSVSSPATPETPAAPAR